MAAAVLLVGFLFADGRTDGLRVNGSDVVSTVWETQTGPGRQPPQCDPVTDDGIGRWRCIVNLDRGAPRTLEVDVLEDGSITGEQGLSACCLEVRDD